MQTMQRRRRNVKTGAALTAAGMVAVTPLVWSQNSAVPALSAIDRSVRLVNGDASILNIPFNLFQDIVNIPGTEIDAMNTMARSLFFTGNWFTPSATNLWGEDPGDPGHFLSLIDMFIPFKEISGLGQPEIDPTADAAGTAGLGQQLALLAAAELPASASCDADWCSPLVPATPITGFSGIDRDIWSVLALTGLQKFPMFNNWFQVPISDLTSGHYNFGDVVDPSKGVGPDGSVPDGFGLPGTVSGPDGENLMPWSDVTFKFDPLEPFQNFLSSLEAKPDYSAFDIPTLAEIGRALQALLAGMVVDFNPFVAGSPACVDECVLAGHGTWTTEGIVRGIGNLWPGNQLIDKWLADNTDGSANGATAEQIQHAIDYLQGQQDTFDIGNPLPSDPPSTIDTPAPFDVGPVGAALIQFMKETGVLAFTTKLADLIGFNPDNNPGGFVEELNALNEKWVDEVNQFFGSHFTAEDVNLAPLQDGVSDVMQGFDRVDDLGDSLLGILTLGIM